MYVFESQVHFLKLFLDSMIPAMVSLKFQETGISKPNSVFFFPTERLLLNCDVVGFVQTYQKT